MNKKQAQRILEEFHKRKIKKVDWLRSDFPAQNNFINDPSKLKVVQCTRRAGKSYGAGIYAFKEAYENPGCSVVILGLTRESVKRIFMKDILSVINRQLDLKAQPNLSDLTWRLPNNSVIYLLGIDANPDDMNKLLGQKNKLVIIDEAAFFRQDLKKLIYEILKPSMIDHDGTIAMISTTSHLIRSFYFDVSNRKVDGWSLHKWTAEDNPVIAEKFIEEKKELLKNNPGIEETPMYRRMYLNEWVIDNDMLVYKYEESRNSVSELPIKKEPWNYVLGIDLGYNDATAFVVLAFHDHDPNVYIIDMFKKSEMIISDVAEKIKEFQDKYDFQMMVVDGASKQAVEEIKQRYDIPLVSTQKTGKRDHIEILNAEMIQGRFKILAGKGDELVTEYNSLVWDERKLTAFGKYEEHASCDNHLADATLYAFRWVYNYAFTEKVLDPVPHSEEAVDAFWERESERVIQPDEEDDLFADSSDFLDDTFSSSEELLF